MIKKALIFIFTICILTSVVYAQDITGTWRQIDDQTGTSKALIEIRKESNNSYTGKIIKITPLPGYTPKEKCVNCPPPYTEKPILGLDVLKDLKHDKENNFTGGKILDPLSGKIYAMKAKLSSNGKRLQMRGYVGVPALGRSQTWIRDSP